MWVRAGGMRAHSGDVFWQATSAALPQKHKPSVENALVHLPLLDQRVDLRKLEHAGCECGCSGASQQEWQQARAFPWTRSQVPAETISFTSSRK